MARPSVQLVQVLTNLSTIICTRTIYIFILSTSIYTNTRSKIWGGGEWGGAGQWCSTIAQLPHYTQHVETVQADFHYLQSKLHGSMYR